MTSLPWFLYFPLSFIRQDFLHFRRDNMKKQREGNILSALNCKIEVEMEPYRTLIGDDTSVTVLQGHIIENAILWSNLILHIVYCIILVCCICASYLLSIISGFFFLFLLRCMKSFFIFLGAKISANWNFKVIWWKHCGYLSMKCNSYIFLSYPFHRFTLSHE